MYRAYPLAAAAAFAPGMIDGRVESIESSEPMKQSEKQALLQAFSLSPVG